jgi:NitT/TauT family transport system substrate-binding protein
MNRTLTVLITGLIATAMLAGCSAKPDKNYTANALKPVPQPVVVSLKIGHVATPDALGLWVAEKEQYFKAFSVDATLVSYATTAERDKALADGKIDGMIADPIAAALLTDGGTPVRIVALTRGATKAESPVAILSGPSTDMTTVKQLKGKAVAARANSQEQYVLESLLQEQGLALTDVTVTPMPDQADRLKALLSGDVAAAVLPEPSLSMAMKKGAHLLASDVNAKVNLSQSVLIFTEKATKEKVDGIRRVVAAYNLAATGLNKNAAKYSDLLVKGAQLPVEIKDSFKMAPFTQTQVPNRAEIEQQLQWLSAKKLLKHPLTYDQLVTVIK